MDTITKNASRRKTNRQRLAVVPDAPKSKTKPSPPVVAKAPTKTAPVVDVPKAAGDENRITEFMRVNKNLVKGYMDKHFEGITQDEINDVLRECAECAVLSRSPKKGGCWDDDTAIIENALAVCDMPKSVEPKKKAKPEPEVDDEEEEVDHSDDPDQEQETDEDLDEDEDRDEDSDADSGDDELDSDDHEEESDDDSDDLDVPEDDEEEEIEEDDLEVPEDDEDQEDEKSLLTKPKAEAKAKTGNKTQQAKTKSKPQPKETKTAKPAKTAQPKTAKTNEKKDLTDPTASFSVDDLKDFKGRDRWVCAARILKQEKKLFVQVQDMPEVVGHLWDVNQGKAKLNEKGFKGKGARSYGKRKLQNMSGVIKDFVDENE